MNSGDHGGSFYTHPYAPLDFKISSLRVAFRVQGFRVRGVGLSGLLVTPLGYDDSHSRGSGTTYILT